MPTSPQIKLDDGHKYMNQLFEAEISKNPKEYSWEYKKFRRIEENKDYIISSVSKKQESAEPKA